MRDRALSGSGDRVDRIRHRHIQVPFTSSRVASVDPTTSDQTLALCRSHPNLPSSWAMGDDMQQPPSSESTASNTSNWQPPPRRKAPSDGVNTSADEFCSKVGGLTRAVEPFQCCPRRSQNQCRSSRIVRSSARQERDGRA